VGVKALAAGLALAVLFIPPASAQRTRFDIINSCERLGMVKFKRHDAAFRRFVIDRASVEADKFADRAGNQFISTVFRGKALYEAGAGPKTVNFICLSGGAGRGPVFVYTLGE
jgi:hypothetical protein